MKINDKILLEHIISDEAKKYTPGIKINDFFEYFCIQKIFQDRNLDDENIESAITDGGDDGGIDSILVFCNDELIENENILDENEKKKFNSIEIFLIQSKYKKSFEEKPLETIYKTIEDIFNLEISIIQLKKVYNPTILEKANLIKKILTNSGIDFPKIKIEIIYATISTEEPNDKLLHLKNKIIQKLSSFFNSSHNDLVFYDCTRLLELSRKTQQTTFKVKISENMSSDMGGIVCLVKLSEFRSLLNINGNFSTFIFEQNVRDYMNGSEVNQEINKSLKYKKLIDFWWLNNGVTIIASKTNLNGKELIIDSPLIVNGQQTSREIYNYFNESNINFENDNRHVLIRVISDIDEETRDCIIKGTNSQTQVKPGQLKSTDKIHRDIEEFLIHKGLYYERRKNYFKNLGKSSQSIITIDQFAQALHSIINKKPAEARSNPSKLITNAHVYSTIFDEKIDLNNYLKIALIYFRTREFLRTKSKIFPRSKDLINHIVLYSFYCLIQKRNFNMQDITKISIENINKLNIPKIVHLTFEHFQKSEEVKNGIAIPQLAKNTASLAILNSLKIEKIENVLII